MRLSTLARAGLCAVLGTFALSSAAADRSLVTSPDAANQALLVGVSHGLPGIDIDVNNLKRISSHSAYNFQPTVLMEKAGTKANVAAELKNAATNAGADGSLLFYYSGHGSPGSIYLQDGSLAVDKIRKALEDGRASQGPMERLVFISDSCYSGTLLDPMRLGLMSQLRDPALLSAITANELLLGLSRSGEAGRAATYWKRLFVFASSRADETSLAGKDGSVFTVAFAKAFEETLTAQGTLGELVGKAQTLTVGHHPVARFAPETFADEGLIN
jgi:hypothetical protein